MLEVFIGYLDAQETDRVHILQFRSTHQYYRTVKYQLDRAIGDGDRIYLTSKYRTTNHHPARLHLGQSSLCYEIQNSNHSRILIPDGTVGWWGGDHQPATSPNIKSQLSPSPVVR